MEKIERSLKGGEEAKRECPKCHGKKIVKAGTRETLYGQTQRFLCKSCDYRSVSRQFYVWTEAID